MKYRIVIETKKNNIIYTVEIRDGRSKNYKPATEQKFTTLEEAKEFIDLEISTRLNTKIRKTEYVYYPK